MIGFVLYCALFGGMFTRDFVELPNPKPADCIIIPLDNPIPSIERDPVRTI